MCLRTAAEEKKTAYDPLSKPSEFKPEILYLDVQDKTRKRIIPIKIYLPKDKSPAPVILFSHGLGGSRDGSSFLGKHWSARRYVAVFIQHPGSDTSVWKNKPLVQRMKAMKQAANGKNFMLRVKDIPAVLDQLARWNKTSGNSIAGRLNLKKIGMSGHSFGAVTTQALSGQAFARGKTPFTDSRIDAAIIMSPSKPKLGTPKTAFGKISLPWLLMTGTHDTSLIGRSDLKSRLTVFPALPAGNKYELVLNQAEHSVFTERALPGDKKPRNPNHHRIILALSTAFWDCYLLNDASAKAWLQGEGAKSILEKDDSWRIK